MSDTGPDGHQEWDEWYAEAPVWSGRPNGALVAKVGALAPGHALDVGCGEGADAVWLAQQGWAVTAIDVAVVALDRGREAARSAGLDVAWRLAGLLDLDRATTGIFDLVSVQYPALRRTDDQAAELALLAAVAPGGVLLVVSHADIDRAAALERGFDPEEYVGHDQVRAALDAAPVADGWVVEVDERRERHVEGGGGTHHTHDLVLRARRTH